MRGGDHAEFVATTAIDDVLVGVDDGWAARAALNWLETHLPRPDAAVRLVSVLEGSGDRSAELARALGRVRGLAEALAEVRPKARIAVEVRDGDVVERLLASPARVLVVGSNRIDDGSDSVLDSVSTRLAARAGCPVVVVPMSWRPSDGPIVAAVAADVPTDEVVDFAAATALREGRPLHLVHVRDESVAAVAGGVPSHDRLLEDAARRAHRAGCGDVTRMVRLGDPADELRATARGASLLVVGRRRRSALERLLLGSVSRKVVGRIDQPVAVVPATDDISG